MQSPSVAAILIVLSSTLPAQRTWVVNDSGPGDFPDLPQAFAASSVQDGDTIRLMGPGNPYTAATTSKALTLFGDPSFGTQVAGLTITNVAAGRAFVIKDLEVSAPFQPIVPLNVLGCAGRVHFEGLLSHTTAPVAIVIRNSGAVTIANSVSHGVLIDNSTVAVSGLTALGSGAGLEVTGSSLVSVGPGCRLTGTGQPAVRLLAGSLSLGGSATTTAAVTGAGTQSISAIQTQGGALRIDPGVALTPANGAPAISGPATVTTEFFPSLFARGVAPGSVLSATAYAPSGTRVVLIASLPETPVTLLPFGTLWIHPAVLFASPMSNTGGNTASFSIPVPSTVPAMFVVALQAVSGTFPVNSLSNPVVVVLR